MKKSLFVVAALGIMGVSASAADLAPACEEYFKLVDQFVEKVKDNPQMAAMKSTYESQKAQFAQLPKDAQEAACKPALDQMKQVIATLPKWFFPPFGGALFLIYINFPILFKF